MFRATREVVKAFQEVNFKCKVEEADGISLVKAGVSGKQTTYQIHFISTDDDNDVAVRVVAFVKGVPEKRVQLLEAANACNERFRFVKFVLDQEGRVNVEADIPQRVTNVGPVAVEITVRIMRILDEVYPVFMKALWSEGT